MSAGSVVPALWPFMPWGPAIDGSKYGLLDTPLNLLKAGQFNKVPTIFGTNANEGSIFVPALILMIPGTNFPPQDADITKGLLRCSC
jgi:carboxylesterase type B